MSPNFLLSFKCTCQQFPSFSSSLLLPSLSLQPCMCNKQPWWSIDVLLLDPLRHTCVCMYTLSGDCSVLEPWKQVIAHEYSHRRRFHSNTHTHPPHAVHLVVKSTAGFWHRIYTLSHSVTSQCVCTFHRQKSLQKHFYTKPYSVDMARTGNNPTTLVLCSQHLSHRFSIRHLRLSPQTQKSMFHWSLSISSLNRLLLSIWLSHCLHSIWQSTQRPPSTSTLPELTR